MTNMETISRAAQMAGIGETIHTFAEWKEVTPLYRLRDKAGLTQAALAEKTGLLKTQISKYERGVASPANMQLGTAAKLAKALGCHAEDLLGKED